MTMHCGFFRDYDFDSEVWVLCLFCEQACQYIVPRSILQPEFDLSHLSIITRCKKGDSREFLMSVGVIFTATAILKPVFVACVSS